MKKTTGLILMCVTVLLSAATVMADGMPAEDTLLVTATPEQIRILCTPESAAVADEDCCARLQRQIDGLRDGLRELRKERGKILGRIAALERGSEQAGVTREDLDNQLEALNKAFVAYNQNTWVILQKQFEGIGKRLAAMDEKNTEQDGRLNGLDGKVADHEGRIQALETDQGGDNAVQVGISVGGIGLPKDSEDVSYSALSLGGRLELRLSEDVYFYGDPSLLITEDSNPFGAMFGGGAGYDIVTTSDGYRASIEFGVTTVGMTMNDQLEFQSVSTLGTIGVAMRYPSGFRVNLVPVAMGARFDRGSPSFSAALYGALGYDFGR